ncbi:MAG: hypothetical protein N2645_18515 [Clostridia bacterium]|nr:hypothetical protein [Clostridia bacterium]
MYKKVYIAIFFTMTTFLISVMAYIFVDMYTTPYKTNPEEITILDYNTPNNNKSLGYSIKKYEGFHFVDWVTDSKVMGVRVNAEGNQVVCHFKILNLLGGAEEMVRSYVNTKDMFSLSPDKKQLAYVEFNIANNTFQENLQILNLAKGWSQPIKRINNTKLIHQEWIDHDNMFIYYSNDSKVDREKWEVIDRKGKIVLSGSTYQPDETIYCKKVQFICKEILVGTDIKNMASGPEGKIYWEEELDNKQVLKEKNQYKSQDAGSLKIDNFYQQDIRSGSVKLLFKKEGNYDYYLDGNKIIALCEKDYTTYIYELDWKGNIKRSLLRVNNKVADFKISPDGNKILYFVNKFSSYNLIGRTLFVSDLRTGRFTEIKSEANIENIKWSPSSKFAGFICSSINSNEKQIASYFIEFVD